MQCASPLQRFHVSTIPRLYALVENLQIISDSWARCRFQTEANVGSVIVVDRATDQKLGGYEAEGSTIEALATLRPLEAESV